MLTHILYIEFFYLFIFKIHYSPKRLIVIWNDVCDYTLVYPYWGFGVVVALTTLVDFIELLGEALPFKQCRVAVKSFHLNID